MGIFVVGIGPGDVSYITPQAVQALNRADVIVGYDLYVELIKELCGGKKIISTGMKREVERVRLAVEEAEKGHNVAVVCSGDAGVYGLAGLVYEISAGRGIDIEVIPGITAACSAAAVLGAPLIHDFAVISLSDLLTPWDKIEKRLSLAAEADFVICIYNPRSLKRKEHLDRAVELIGIHRAASTPCGYVKNAGRQGQISKVCTLGSLASEDIDMFTTVIIGNSQTGVIDGRLVTPRGYKGV